MINIKYYIAIIVLFFSIKSDLFSQVLISSGTGSPHESAMLEIRSTTQGMLIPRMRTSDRTSISNPQSGLLVFDTDLNSFFIFGQGKWNDLSTPAGIWETKSSNVFLSNSYTNVGIGTGNPTGKFVIKADNSKAPDDVLFEIQDNSGKPVFVVTSEGARLYINDLSKAASGGFAVGRYNIAKKGIPDTTYFMVSPDSTRVYTGVSGGFAVGKYGLAKGKQNYNFFTGVDSTRVYAQDGMKGISGGFAVGRYGIAKGPQSYSFFSAKDSTRVYTDNAKAVSGGFAVGKYGLAKNIPTYLHLTPDNYFIGSNAGANTLTGTGNIFIGTDAGLNISTGNNNVFIGNLSGSSPALSGSLGNVFIGNNAGSGETGNNKLYIHNGVSDANTALVYGNFSTGNESVNLNGTLRFNRGSETITLPSTRGNLNEVLTIGSGGLTSWEDVDNLVTFPTPYEAPVMFVNFEGDFVLSTEDNIGTLIEKTAGAQSIKEFLPPVGENYDRIIKIKNDRKSSSAIIIPDGIDVIEGGFTNEIPLTVKAGETYTFQAGDDKDTGLRTWFIIDYSSEALENINTLLKSTSTNYDFNSDIDGPRVYTLVITSAEVTDIRLPSSSPYPNRIVIIKNAAEGGKANIVPDGSDQIDGSGGVSFANMFETYMFQSDGTGNWYIINHTP